MQNVTVASLLALSGQLNSAPDTWVIMEFHGEAGQDDKGDQGGGVRVMANGRAFQPQDVAGCLYELATAKKPAHFLLLFREGVDCIRTLWGLRHEHEGLRGFLLGDDPLSIDIMKVDDEGWVTFNPGRGEEIFTPLRRPETIEGVC